MAKTEKGCVYFFRHVGLSPVKIGYSEENSPINRFISFKTYAPYGSEILGFIESYDAKEIETILHNKFSSKRLKGEWFEISIEEIDCQIKLYSDAEDLESKRKFELDWAMHKKKYTHIKKTPKEIFIEMYLENPNIKKSKIARDLGVTRSTLYNWIEEIV